MMWSRARSHACHIGWWEVGGRVGWDSGVQLYNRITRSASRKLRNKLATRRSCRNNFWNKAEVKRRRKELRIN